MKMTTQISDRASDESHYRSTDAEHLRKFPPIKRGKIAAYLVKFAATWQGDDLEECLNTVHQNRSPAQF